MIKVESGLQQLLEQVEWYSDNIISDLVGELRRRKIITENTDTPITITMEHVSRIPPTKSELITWLVRGDANDMIDLIKHCRSRIKTYNPFLV